MMKRRNVIDLLQEMCDLYKFYVRKAHAEIGVAIVNNKIFISLYKDKYLIDEIQFTFSDEEINLYMYFCFIILKMLLGNEFVYSNQFEVRFNSIDGKCGVLIQDKKILDSLFELFENNNDNKDILNNKKLMRSLRNKDVFRQLDERLGLSRIHLERSVM